MISKAVLNFFVKVTLYLWHQTNNRYQTENMNSIFKDLRFLIVDDFVDMRSVLRNMLTSFGVTKIDMAVNGKEAIKLIEQKRFDVILCDYNLGEGRDGQQVLEEIRHRKLIGVGSVFVMVTAENTRVMVMGAVEYEPDSYLTKPFTKNLLGKRLNRLLTKKADLIQIEHAINNLDYDLANRLIDEKLADDSQNKKVLQKAAKPRIFHPLYYKPVIFASIL